MRRQGALRIVVMITIIGMMISSLPMGYEKGGLDESQERREQLGPDEPTLEERCSVLTFEDMFEYTKQYSISLLPMIGVLPKLKQLPG